MTQQKSDKVVCSNFNAVCLFIISIIDKLHFPLALKLTYSLLNFNAFPPWRIQWKLLLEPTIPSMTSNNINAREIQLLLERKRLSMWGITSYEMHNSSGKIVFPFASTLYQCLDTGYSVNITNTQISKWNAVKNSIFPQTIALFPSELRISQLWAALDPQICPDNSDLIAYVSGGDIWVTHTLSGDSERLTFAHDGRKVFAEDPLSAGVPSYVMQEEFSRYQGYWWQPKSEGKCWPIIVILFNENAGIMICRCRWYFPHSLRRSRRKRGLPIHVSIVPIGRRWVRRVSLPTGRHSERQV